MCGLKEIAVHSLPIEPTVVAALRARLAGGTALSSVDALDVMRDSYRSYVRCNTPRFRALFAHLLEDRAPLVVHCTAGKDRTGFACALILHALGVPDETIADDYLLTNRFYRRDPSASQRTPRRRQAGAGVGGDAPSLPPHSRPSAPITAIWKAISATGWAWAQANAPNSRRYTWNPEIPRDKPGRRDQTMPASTSQPTALLSAASTRSAPSACPACARLPRIKGRQACLRSSCKAGASQSNAPGRAAPCCRYAAASTSASRSAMTSSNAEIAC